MKYNLTKDFHPPLFTELQNAFDDEASLVFPHFSNYPENFRISLSQKMSRRSEDVVCAEEIHDLLDSFSKNSYKVRGDPRVSMASIKL